MSGVAFALHLGGNLYLDSNGDLHQGTPPKTAIYEAPYKLPVDPQKVRNALGSVKEALKSINRDQQVINMFNDLGLPLKFLDILSGIGRIAGILAPVASVLSMAYDIAKIFGFFKEGPSALERLVKERFDELNNGIVAIGLMITSKDLRNGRNAVENFSATVYNYVSMLKNSNPSLTQLENEKIALQNSHEAHINFISHLLDKQTWMSVFDRDEHGRVWMWISYVLFTMPGGPGVAPVPALLPADNTLNFDHRLMVPMASYAAEGYLACIRGISPEYRTTGDFRENLKNFAKKIEDLAQAMRELVLARTIYQPSHFGPQVLIPPHEVIQSGVLGLGAAKLSPKCSRWPVGALDLRYHDNSFFGGFLDSLGNSEVRGWPHPTKCGGMDFRWVPPAVLELAEFGNYRIINPEECAAAANEQSERDFAELLSVSGYFELLQLAALFRHEFTAPETSQTVQCNKPNLYRNPLPSSTVTVTSKISLADEIKSSARREPQECAATTNISTQPIKRARPVQYQIKLRTLYSLISVGSWQEPEYSQFQWAQYEPDPASPDFLQLKLYESNLALDEHLLLEGWQSSPRDQPIRKQGVAELVAHTFDWWIPVKTPFSIDKDFKRTLEDLRGHGWNGHYDAQQVSLEFTDPVLKPPDLNLRQSMSYDGLLLPTSSYVPRVDDFVPELYWKPGGQDWDGHRRDIKKETIKIDYSLVWTADQLYVEIKNNPEYRNYVVYIVVEEKMTSTGQVLHTAVPVPINGLLTYVPQKFFDDEMKAIAEAARIINEFYKMYSKNRVPSPVDPIIGWIRPGDLVSLNNIDRFVQLAQQHEPEILREAIVSVKS